MLASSLLGTIGAAAALGPESLSAVVAGSWRAAVGGSSLVMVSVVRRQAPWRYPLPLPWVALGGVGVASSQLAFFEAVFRTGVAVGTLVAIGTGPIAAGGIDWLVYGRRPGRLWLVGVVVALGGVVLLTGGARHVVWSGVGFGLLAGTAFPFMAFTAQRLMRDRPMLPAMATVLGAGAVLMLPIAVFSADVAFASVASVSTVLYLGLATLTGAHILWGIGLKHLSLSVVVAVTLLEPAVAAILAMTVLDEPLTVGLLIGVCLTIAGVALTSTKQATTTSPTMPLATIRGQHRQGPSS